MKNRSNLANWFFDNVKRMPLYVMIILLSFAMIAGIVASFDLQDEHLDVLVLFAGVLTGFGIAAIDDKVKTEKRRALLFKQQPNRK